MDEPIDDRDFVTRWLEAKATDTSANQDVLKAISSHRRGTAQQERDLLNLIVSLADERLTNDVADKAD